MKKKGLSWRRYSAALLAGLIMAGTSAGVSTAADAAVADTGVQVQKTEPSAVPVEDLSGETAENDKQNTEDETDQQPVKLDRPVIRVSRHTVNTLRISWNEVPAANGYYVYRAYGKKERYVRAVKIRGGSRLSFVDRVKPGRTCYYKVKAYHSERSADSAFSSVKGGKAYPLYRVPYCSQKKYPTGCESASAVMLLNYCGANTTVKKFISRLPKGELHYLNGRVWGPHPGEAFIGSPYSFYGLGCYAPVVARTMNRLLPSGRKAVALSGLEIEELHTCLDRGQPVLIWATVNMVPSRKTRTWQTDRGSFRWTSKEHCLVLTGYDRYYYYFNDPYNGNGRVRYWRPLVRQRYNEMHRQAVIVEKV